MEKLLNQLNSLNTPLIMVVEDNPITLKMVGITLRAEDYRVLEAQDGKSALEFMTHETPDLILQDLLLPDIHGGSGQAIAHAA